jgi:predicted  nucleic acid-binding Zn-ribbon protein
MKNIMEICKDFGIEIPADKHTEFNKAVAENYKTVAEHEKKVNRLTEDLAAEKKRADDAVETLKGFEGKDFDAITKDRDEWQRKHNELVETHKKETEEREFNEMLSAAISETKGKNTKAITALLDLDALRKSKNQEKDIKAALEGVKKDNEYLFDVTGAPPARFDEPGKGGAGGGGNATVKEIMAIKDPVERQAKIVQNMHLFKKG